MHNVIYSSYFCFMFYRIVIIIIVKDASLLNKPKIRYITLCVAKYSKMFCLLVSFMAVRCNCVFHINEDKDIPSIDIDIISHKNVFNFVQPFYPAYYCSLAQ